MILSRKFYENVMQSDHIANKNVTFFHNFESTEIVVWK